MGVFSRKVLPVCAGVCCCFCPGLRARSKKPIKRYNQYLGDIFKAAAEEGTVNEKQIGKLADYAAENPDRIPLIVSKLEERGAREAQAGKAGSTVPAIVRCFAKLAAECGDHMSLVAGSSLSLSQKLLESKSTETRALGCRNIEVLLDAQTDTAFASPVDALLPSIIAVAREPIGTDGATTRAAALGAIRAYICFNSRFRRVPPQQTWDQIIGAVLDSYSRTKSALSGTPEAGQGAASQGGPSSAASSAPAGKEPTSPLAPVDCAREQLYGAIASARKAVRPPQGPVAWGRLFPTLSKDQLDDPAVASLSCVWALSLLLSPSAAADYLLPHALRPMLAYVSNGGFWSAPLGDQVLTDLRDSLTLLGATVKRERYIKYQLIQGLVELLVDPASPVPQRDQPEALSVLRSLLTDMGASGLALQVPQGGPLRHPQAGPTAGGEGTQEGAQGQETGQEEGGGLQRGSVEAVRVPAMWTSSFGYAASEAICVEALCNMLARHLAQGPPSHQGVGSSVTPGAATFPAGEAGTGGGTVEGRTEAAIVGCAAEQAQLIGAPEDYLNALAVTLEGIPAAAVEETKGAVRAVSILAKAGLARLIPGAYDGTDAAAAAAPSASGAAGTAAAGAGAGAGLAVSSGGGVGKMGSVQNGGTEGGDTEEILECPQRVFNAVLQVLSSPDAGARLAAHELLDSLFGGSQSTDHLESKTDDTKISMRSTSGLVLTEDQRSLLLSALWHEISSTSGTPGAGAGAGTGAGAGARAGAGEEAGAAVAFPASCVAMGSTFRLAVAPGGKFLLEEATQLALSVRARGGGALQDTPVPATSRRCLLSLASCMLRTLVARLPVKDKVGVQSLISEMLPKDPFLAVNGSGGMEEVTAGSPGFGSLEDKEAAAAELAALGPKEKRLQPQRKIADALAAALVQVPRPQGDVSSGGEVTSAGAAEVTVRLLEEYTPSSYLEALRLSYLASASDLPPSASPTVLLTPPLDPSTTAAHTLLPALSTSLTPAAGAGGGAGEGGGSLLPALTPSLVAGAHEPSSFGRHSEQGLIGAVDAPEAQDGMGRRGGAPSIPPVEEIVKSIYEQDKSIADEGGAGDKDPDSAGTGVSQALAILGATS